MCVCPLTEGNLGDGIPDLTAPHSVGGRLALGSDANTRISPIEEMRWLEYGQRLRAERRGALADPRGGVAACVLEAATSGGAAALGDRERPHRAGGVGRFRRHQAGVRAARGGAERGAARGDRLRRRQRGRGGHLRGREVARGRLTQVAPAARLPGCPGDPMFAFLLTLLILDALLSQRGRPAAGRPGRRTRLARRRHDRHGARRAPGGHHPHQGHLVVRRDLPRALPGALAGAAGRRLHRAAGAAPRRHAASAPASAPLPLGGTPHRCRTPRARRRLRQPPRHAGPARSRQRRRGLREPDDRSPRFRFARGRRLVRRDHGAPARSRLRRGGLHHQPHRLSGDVHRSELPRPDRGDDRADDRELRRQSGGHGVGAAAGERRGGARALAPALQLARHASASTTGSRRPEYR